MAGKIGRVFLDSNVILSGLFSEGGAPRILLDLLSLDLPFLTGLTGRYNLLEIERNLIKKMPACIPLYKSYLSKLNVTIVPLPSSEELEEYLGVTADKDVPVLVSALKGKADFLVTGDKKDFSHLKMAGAFPFKIVSPSEFLVIIPDLLV
jgi:predicted nucleic acid-binding protein